MKLDTWDKEFGPPTKASDFIEDRDILEGPAWSECSESIASLMESYAVIKIKELLVTRILERVEGFYASGYFEAIQNLGFNSFATRAGTKLMSQEIEALETLLDFPCEVFRMKVNKELEGWL